MEIWEAIEPHFWQIVTSLGMIFAIIFKVPGKTKEQKAQQKFDKAHKTTMKAEKNYHVALKKEAELEKELKK